MLMEDIKEDLNKWREFTDWKTQYSKDVTSPKLIYSFSAIPIKIPVSFFFFIDLGNISLKLIWKSKGNRIAKPFEKEE